MESDRCDRKSNDPPHEASRQGQGPSTAPFRPRSKPTLRAPGPAPWRLIENKTGTRSSMLRARDRRARLSSNRAPARTEPAMRTLLRQSRKPSALVQFQAGRSAPTLGPGCQHPRPSRRQNHEDRQHRVGALGIAQKTPGIVPRHCGQERRGEKDHGCDRRALQR